MFGNDAGVNTTAHIKIGGEAHESRRNGCHEVGQYTVGYVLMKSALVAIGPDIQFKGFELDTQLLRDVFQMQFSKVRLAGFRAQAGEFWRPYTDGIITRWPGVWKYFQVLVGLSTNNLTPNNNYRDENKLIPEQRINQCD